MSNKQNDILVDDVIDYVDGLMDINPTIPAEARNDLIVAEIRKRMEETIEDEGGEHYE